MNISIHVYHHVLFIKVCVFS